MTAKLRLLARIDAKPPEYAARVEEMLRSAEALAREEPGTRRNAADTALLRTSTPPDRVDDLPGNAGFAAGFHRLRGFVAEPEATTFCGRRLPVPPLLMPASAPVGR